MELDSSNLKELQDESVFQSQKKGKKFHHKILLTQQQEGVATRGWCKSTGGSFRRGGVSKVKKVN
jgi:hypothetical protein